MSSSTLPEFWDAPAGEPPVEARPFGWLLTPLAALGLMLVPRRLGPRISRTGWGRALFIHAVTLLCVGALAVFVAEPTHLELLVGSASLSSLTMSERLRLPAVLLVELLRAVARDADDVYALLAAVAGAHASCWLAGWLLMPFIAAGDRSRSAYLRAVKLALWSTSCVIVLLALVAAARYVQVKTQFFDYLSEDLIWPTIAGIWLLWWISVLLRLGARYAGPAEGPGWTPRRPTCVRCTYVLTGLNSDGRCPECGLEVAASLPKPRHVPVWADARGPVRRWKAYLATLWTILRRPEFFDTLAVSRGREAAIRFAVYSCWLAGLWFAANATIPFIYETITDVWPRAWPLEGATIVVLVFVATVVAGMLFNAGLTLLMCLFGRRDPRPTTVAVCYVVVVFLTPLMAATTGFWMVYFLHTLVRREWFWSLKSPYDHLLNLLLILVIAVPAVPVFVWAVRRFQQALRAVRHAA